MPTKKQHSHPSGQVVSVRLDSQTIKRLDELAERTSRSRGFYLKAAIREMLPRLEEASWSHVMPRINEVDEDSFHGIVESLFTEDGFRRKETEDG